MKNTLQSSNRLSLSFCFFALFFSLSSFAQQATFNWNDTVFTRWAERAVKVEWGLDDCRLRKESYDTLKPVIKFMKDNPTIKIEVGDHLDPRGSYNHNMKLSKARAQSVADFLISQGVDSARIAVTGYGALRPLPGCNAGDIARMKTMGEKEAAWQADRRMMIKIIAPDSGNIFNWGDDRFMKYSRRAVHIAFELDRAELRPDSESNNKQILDTMVNFLKGHNYLKVVIYVHTDPQGTSHSHPLSQARAWSVANALIAKGIDSARIVAKGWGSTRPIIPAKKIELMKTKEEKQVAWQTDRRVELVILGTMKKL